MQGRLEMELAQMPPEDAVEFLSGYGITEPGLNRVIRVSYELLGLHSFFTVGEDEVRAWTIPVGAPAVEAAGVIHTDLARGFIRAEVISLRRDDRRGQSRQGQREGAAAAGRQGVRRSKRRYPEHPVQRLAGRRGR